MAFGTSLVLLLVPVVDSISDTVEGVGDPGHMGGTNEDGRLLVTTTGDDEALQPLVVVEEDEDTAAAAAADGIGIIGMTPE